MTIKPLREIENNTFKVTIKPSSMGTATTTAEAEAEMLVDFPQTLRYSDVTFTDKFKVVSGLPVISADVDAVEIAISNLVNKEYKVDENLEIYFEVSADKISSSEVDGTVFTNTLEVAQAKVILFETKILARIKELMDAARANVNDYEITTEVIL